MRLIDADELLTAFPVDDEPTLTKSCVRMTIKNMPTIEPQTKKGYWRNLKFWRVMKLVGEKLMEIRKNAEGMKEES